MLFKSEQIRFVEMDQTLASQAVYASGMNAPAESQPSFDPFAGNADFGNSEFGNPDIR